MPKPSANGALPAPPPSPHDLHAEEAALAACLVNEDVVPYVFAACDPEDFYERRNQDVARAIRNLWERAEAVNQVTVTTELGAQGRLQAVGGNAYLHLLIGSLPKGSDATSMGKLVKRYATYRKLIDAGEAISGIGKAALPDLDDALSRALGLVEELAGATAGGQFVTIEETIIADKANFEAMLADPLKLPGRKTGFPAIDFTLGGYVPGLLYLIAARPGMGKTAVGLNSAWKSARGSGPVLYVTREAHPKELKNRLLFTMAAIDWQKVKDRAGAAANRKQSVNVLTPEERKALADQETILSKLPIVFEASTGEAARLKMQIRAAVRRFGVQTVFIDHIDLLSARGNYGGSRVQEMSAITRALKDAAMENNVPVVALSQLSREVEKRGDKAPTLADLRDSGSKEQDAQGIIFLHRPAYYLRDLDPHHPAQRLIYFDVAKNTYGPAAKHALHINLGTGLVSDWASPLDRQQAEKALSDWLKAEKERQKSISGV